MVNGRILAYGSPSYLMETYGGGYEVGLTIDVLKIDRRILAKRLMSLIPGKFRLLSQEFSPESD